MIVKDMCYRIQCDSCGEFHESDEGQEMFRDKDSAVESAQDDDWIDYDGLWYCPKCYHEKEDMSEFIPND